MALTLPPTHQIPQPDLLVKRLILPFDLPGHVFEFEGQQGDGQFLALGAGGSNTLEPGSKSEC